MLDSWSQTLLLSYKRLEMTLEIIQYVYLFDRKKIVKAWGAKNIY